MKGKIWPWAVFAGAMTALAVLFAPDPPRMGFYSAAVEQQRALSELGADLYAPHDYEAYRRTLESARSELAEQFARFYYSRDYRNFDRLSREALEAGGLAERAAFDNRQSLKRQETNRIASITADISDIRARGARLGLSAKSRTRLVRADVLIREADQMGRSGRWLDVQDRVEAAETLVGEVSQDQSERSGRFSQSDLIQRWETHVRETIAWSIQRDAGVIIVDKSRNQCLLIDAGRVIKTYAADFGTNGVFDKSVQGDRATPEGKYKITKKKGAGQSKFHKALLLNYPNDEDLREFRRARARGQVSARTRPGGAIEIHGEGGQDKNWTEGCVALRNSDMDDLFRRVDVGTPVTIVGRYMAFDRLGMGP
ncbi:L,D-transpeptidase [bacterium]|nr:L,D-transpeptidase [bacterium]